MPGTLYLVATPIGNLKDITLRAIEVLRTADLIACEDTRHTQKLLNHLRISARTISFHEHNEDERTEHLVDRIIAGESVAVVSDAGTPAISDPGHKLVRRAHQAGIPVVPIPGPVAFVSGLIASGLPTDSVFFVGFLPSKKGERQKRLEEVRSIPATLAFYEAPHRILKTLHDCIAILGDREASIARELTKLHEEIFTGRMSEIIEHFSAKPVKGEIVLTIDRGSSVVSAKEDTSAENISSRVAALESEGVETKKALKIVAKEFGLSKSEVYRHIKIKK